nr:hypothetical protein [Tanacetum cinerariifolium]
RFPPRLTEIPRVPVPFPEDPYGAIRQAYLVETKTSESPHIVASPTSLPDSTPPMHHAEDSMDSETSGARSTPSDSIAPLSPDHPLTHASPTLAHILRRIARMVVRVSPAMSPSLSASIAEVVAMSDSVFRKRFRSSYDSSPSASPPNLPSQKRYRGTSGLVDDDKEEGDEEEDEEIEESLDSDSESDDPEDEGPIAEDEDPATRDEGLAAASVVETNVGEPLGLGYREMRRREITLGEGQMPSAFKVGKGFGSVSVPERLKRVSALRQPTLTTWIDPEDVPSIIPLPISSPMIPLTVPSPVASPAMAETEGFLTELGAWVEMQEGLIHDHTSCICNRLDGVIGLGFSSCSTSNVQEKTHEDHSNQIRALNVDSLKVDLVFIQNPCSETEDSNSETASSKSVKESSLNSATKDVHAIKYKMSKAKERCMTYFRSLHSHLQVLSKEDLKGTRIEHGFKRAFMSLSGQDADTFTSTMLFNVDHLQKQLDKDEFQEDGFMTAFWGVNNQFQEFIDSHVTLDYDSQMTKKYFVEYTGIEVKHFRDTLLQHMESSGTESEVQDDNSRSRNDTDADNADIRPIYDEEPMEKVQLTAECNIFAIRQQHTEQPEIINEGRVDHVDTKFAKTSVLRKPVLRPLRNQSVVRQPNACKHERPPMSKQRFASQVDVNHNVSKPVTQHYLPLKSESAFTKPDHMIASSSFRNSSKNMPRFSSNDMVYNHYLDEAKKKTQERDRNSKPSTMASDQNSSDPTPKCQTTALNHYSLSPAIQRQEKVTQTDRTVTTSNELDFQFSLMFDELLNGSSKVVSKSSAVSAADAPNQRQ